MKSGLEALFNDGDFGTGAIGHDNGIMIHSDFPVDYLILEYGNRFDVYLNLYDEGEAPYRNILVKGSSKKLEIVKNIAIRKLEKECENHIH